MDYIKKLSVIIPAHNEEKIIEQTLHQVVGSFKRNGWIGEIIVVENGSQDKTAAILKGLANKYRRLKIATLPLGDKGLALKKGMKIARFDNLMLIDADLWDEGFVKNALDNLKEYDVVIGSKSIKGAKDQRSISARVVSRLYNLVFKLVFDFKGTETHAKLAFRRKAIMPIVSFCQTGGLVFDTELVIRVERSKLSKLEIPTTVKEIRPRVFSVKKEFLNVYKEFVLLLKTLGPSPNKLVIFLGSFLLVLCVFKLLLR